MSFTLPAVPLPSANSQEIADLAELFCLKSGRISFQELARYFAQGGDNELNEGLLDDDEKYEIAVGDAFSEIEHREKACGREGNYPFQVSPGATSIELRGGAGQQTPSLVYKFLLLATRLDMSRNHEHAGLKGFELLEELAAEVLSNYLGGQQADSLVFGTAHKGGFKEKVNTLCKRLGEGGGFGNTQDIPVNARDGGLDVVAWVPFSDGNPGKLILFAQCKTGTNWKSHVSSNKLTNFTRFWWRKPLIYDPVRVYCVAECESRLVRVIQHLQAGILFDRCRLVDFCPDLKPQTLARITAWTEAAFQFPDVSEI